MKLFLGLKLKKESPSCFEYPSADRVIAFKSFFTQDFPTQIHWFDSSGKAVEPWQPLKILLHFPIILTVRILLSASFGKSVARRNIRVKDNYLIVSLVTIRRVECLNNEMTDRNNRDRALMPPPPLPTTPAMGSRSSSRSRSSINIPFSENSSPARSQSSTFSDNTKLYIKGNAQNRCWACGSQPVYARHVIAVEDTQVSRNVYLQLKVRRLI